MLKKVLLLAISIALAILAAFIQQVFISDNPVKTSIEINKNYYTLKLPVVYEGIQECLIELPIADSSVSGVIYYKVAKANDDWKTNSLIRMNDNLVSILPAQKPNVKLEYFITLTSKGITYKLPIDKPVIIRFQDIVAKMVYYPFVILLFISLILSCYTGLLSAYNIQPTKKYIKLTFYFLLGSIILGLSVHLIAFRHLFLQISPNNDLSFYKNLLIFLLWLGIFYLSKKHENRYIILTVSVLTLILYCYPQHLLFNWISN
jgi:hypothetical protein